MGFVPESYLTPIDVSKGLNAGGPHPPNRVDVTPLKPAPAPAQTPYLYPMDGDDQGAPVLPTTSTVVAFDPTQESATHVAARSGGGHGVSAAGSAAPVDLHVDVPLIIMNPGVRADDEPPAPPAPIEQPDFAASHPPPPVPPKPVDSGAGRVFPSKLPVTRSYAPAKSSPLKRVSIAAPSPTSPSPPADATPEPPAQSIGTFGLIEPPDDAEWKSDDDDALFNSLISAMRPVISAATAVAMPTIPKYAPDAPFAATAQPPVVVTDSGQSTVEARAPIARRETAVTVPFQSQPKRPPPPKPSMPSLASS